MQKALIRRSHSRRMPRGKAPEALYLSGSRRALSLSWVRRRASGGTGRRAGFRFQWGNPSEFESLLAQTRCARLGCAEKFNKRSGIRACAPPAREARGVPQLPKPALLVRAAQRRLTGAPASVPARPPHAKRAGSPSCPNQLCSFGPRREVCEVHTSERFGGGAPNLKHVPVGSGHHPRTASEHRGSSSAVEHRLAKARVASSNLVFRSTLTPAYGAPVAGDTAPLGESFCRRPPSPSSPPRRSNWSFLSCPRNSAGRKTARSAGS